MSGTWPPLHVYLNCAEEYAGRPLDLLEELALTESWKAGAEFEKVIDKINAVVSMSPAEVQALADAMRARAEDRP